MQLGWHRGKEGSPEADSPFYRTPEHRLLWVVWGPARALERAFGKMIRAGGRGTETK